MTNLTKILILLFLTIGIVHLTALQSGWYYIYPRIDIPMHIVGGVWAAILFFWIFEIRKDNYLFVTPWWISEILALSFVAFIGVLWEFSEFLYDVFISPSRGYAYVTQMGVVDTMKDLFFDLVGGLAAWVTIIRIKKTKMTKPLH